MKLNHDDNHLVDDPPPKGLFAAFLSFLSVRFSLSDRSGVFLALGFRGDLSGIGPPVFPFILHDKYENP